MRLTIENPLATECVTCDGTGEVHSHNPKCWDCRGQGFIVGGNKWKPPNGTNEYCETAYRIWLLTGKLSPDQPRPKHETTDAP